MTSSETVLDAGPIPYADIALCGDPDLEHGLRHAGYDPDTTSYRLIEIALTDISETKTMDRWPSRGTAYVDAAQAGVAFPPMVVLRTAHGWGLLDGVNRTYAYWVLGHSIVRAYELLTQ